MAKIDCLISGNQNHDEDDDASSSSSRKRLKTNGNNGVASWSDVNHDVLFLVMMQLRVVDFIAFSVVCKSWRSLALSNKNTFMASKPPMKILTTDSYCYLNDFEGKKFKTIIPHFADSNCFGITCGYLILYGRKTRDFWLVHPITRHELHFPDYPVYVSTSKIKRKRGILVFSRSISGWVFIMLYKKISFCIAGKRGWNHVSSTVPISDLHFFKGKIYTLHTDCSLCELKLHLKSKHKWTLHESKKFPYLPNLFKPVLLGSDEKIYVIDGSWLARGLMELDFGKMEWVLPEKTIGEYAFFFNGLNVFGVIKPKSWARPWIKYKGSLNLFAPEGMWYFPSDCLNVNLLDE